MAYADMARAAGLEAMTDRAIKAEALEDKIEKDTQAANQEANAARERAQAEAAELRGRLAAADEKVLRNLHQDAAGEAGQLNVLMC